MLVGIRIRPKMIKNISSATVDTFDQKIRIADPIRYQVATTNVSVCSSTSCHLCISTKVIDEIEYALVVINMRSVIVPVGTEPVVSL